MLRKFNAVLKSKKIKIFYYGIFSLLIFLILTALITYHFFLIPNVENYKQNIESFIASETGGEASIDKLNIVWDVTNPRFQLRNFSITDKDNNKTIHLKAVDFQISWLSLLKLKPVLNQIIIGDLDILIERSSENKLKVAGIEIIETSESSLPNWLLNQKELRLINGKITWRDRLRDAQDLIIDGINFTYTSPTYLTYLDRHKFNLNALISAGTKERIYLNGYFDLDSIHRIDQIKSKLNINISQAILPAFKSWFDYPFDIKQGYGDLKVNMTVLKNKIKEVKASFNLDNYIGNFNENQEKYININEMSGNAIFENFNTTIKIASTNLNFKTNDIDIKNSAFEIISKNNQAESLKLKLNDLNIVAAEALLSQTPFFNDLKFQLENYNPAGEIQDLKLSWKKNKELFLSGSLNGFSIASYNDYPGITNLSANIDIKNNSGFIDINSENFVIEHKDYLRTPFNFDHLEGVIKINDQDLKFTNLLLKNKDISSSISGLMNFKNEKEPILDVTVNLTVPDISKIKSYYPKTTDPDLLDWLDTSLVKGNIVDSKIKIKNSFDKISSNKSETEIQFFGNLNDATIYFANNYPEIKKTDIRIEYQNNKLNLSTSNGLIANQKINSLDLTYDFMDDDSIIITNWITSGNVSNLISAINNSPLYEDTQEFTNQLVADGTGNLNLKLFYPIKNPENIDFKAKYEFENASIQNQRIGLPKLDNLNAILDLKPEFYELRNASAKIFDMPIDIKLSSIDATTKIDATGQINQKFFINNLGENWSEKINGSAAWYLKAILTKESNTLSIESDLKGLSIEGPPPLTKTQDEIRMFSIVRKPSKELTTNYILQLENDVKGKVYFDNNRWSGQVNIFSNEEFKKRQGISIFANLNNIDADDFSKLFKFKTNTQQYFKIGKSKINFEKLTVDGFNFNRLETTLFPSNTGVKLSLYSNEIKGNVLWDLNENSITGRFNKLIFNSESQLAKLNKKDKFPSLSLPILLDVKIDEVVWNDKILGKLEINSSNKNTKLWTIDNLTIINPQHIFTADGEWIETDAGSMTKIDFKWKVDDLEKTMDQIGYPNLVKKGNARFNGIANWEGSPFNFSTEQITGNFSMDIDKGEILEAKPGIGRLFGLLTLQNLPKRLSLDFSDLFSKGFIFDSINAGVRINSGILSSNNFKMSGPAAEVLMDGEVDIMEETQNLHVTVKPFVSDSLSLAALAGGPLAGAAAFIAQKVLKDPLNKVLTDEYQITGTWDEPIEINKTNAEELSELVDEEVIEPSDSVLEKLNIFKNKNE